MNILIKNILRFFMIIFTSLLSMILIVLIFAVICSAFGIMFVVDTLENTTEISIPETEKEKSSYIYSINEETGEYNLIYKVTPYTGNVRIDIDIETLPDYVTSAFVCTEDERFYSHDGVDIKTTAFAVIKEVLRCSGIISPEVTGGSTITQQLVKNITGDSEITADRKIREIFRAVDLEKKYTKDEILEKYLNVIYFGQTPDGYNMYGIEAAAIGYFGVNASDLTIAQAASLAAIPMLPNGINPIVDNKANDNRKRYCLRKMFEQGIISPFEYEKAINEKITTSDKSHDTSLLKLSDYPNDFENPEPTTWVIDTALSEFCDYICESENISRDDAMQKFMSGGYELYLTVDNRIQKHLEEKYSDYTYFPENTAEYTDESGNTIIENIQSAIVVMNYKGQIKGIVGRIGEKTDSFCWNNATDARRQPGSTIKPLSVYTYGIENNLLTWSDLFVDTPLEAGIADEYAWPNNYTKTFSDKMITTNEALTNSLNTIPAQLCNTYGLQNVFDFTTNVLKLPLNENNDVSYAALSVGATTTGPSLVSLANSYMPFGNDGIYYKAHIINRIKDSGSKRVYIEKDAKKGTRVISSETAYIMNKMLRNVITDGTGKKALLTNKQNIGKTGTTEQYRDITFVGLTEDFVSAIWIGYENGMNSYAIQNTNSASVWKNVFGDFADNYVSDASFPKCESVIYIDFCSESGMPAAKNCPVKEKGYYRSDNCNFCHIKHTPPDSK